MATINQTLNQSNISEYDRSHAAHTSADQYPTPHTLEQKSLKTVCERHHCSFGNYPQNWPIESADNLYNNIYYWTCCSRSCTNTGCACTTADGVPPAAPIIMIRAHRARRPKLRIVAKLNHKNVVTLILRLPRRRGGKSAIGYRMAEAAKHLRTLIPSVAAIAATLSPRPVKPRLSVVAAPLSRSTCRLPSTH